jgi:hypothetical protein
MAKDVPEYGAEEDVWMYERKVVMNCRKRQDEKHRVIKK